MSPRLNYVPALLEAGCTRAAAEGLSIDFIEADAENLPFDNDSFDTVVSTFGVMFTPNQDKAAAELLRVLKRRGHIGLANWTPEGFIGQVFKTLGKYLPPPTGARSPALWGTRARLTELFGSEASSIKAEPRSFNFRYRSPEHFSRCVQNFLWPSPEGVRGARADEAGRASRRSARSKIVRMNRAGDGTMIVPSEYLEVVITKR
jgi:SAM-dependent methyltransferase